MELVSEQLAAFASGVDTASIPEPVRRRAACLVLDGVGIAFASTTFDFAGQAIDALSGFEPGDCPLLGVPRTLALRDAALVNGILVHGLDFDDTHLVGVVHATASCLPAALAGAWASGCSGRELLTAYIIGMEVAARLGAVARGEMNQIGFHPTGVVAAFACALTAGRLAGLSCEQLVMAQGIVLSMAAGTREYSSNGSSSKRMHPGWAAACGLTAVRLAAAGFTGPRSTYEGRFGLYATHLSANPEKWALPAASAGLGTVWETLQVAIKPFPACQLSISCIDAAIGLATRHAVDPARIVRIEALIPQHAVAIVCEPAAAKRRPASARDVQFSLQFDIACALLRGRFGLAELELYRDPRILALADKVEYRVDPDTGYPKHFSGEVIVTLDDGRRVSQREQVNLGAADNPVPQEGIIGKFIGNATMAVDEVRARSVCERVLAIDEEEDARALVRFLGGAGR